MCNTNLFLNVTVWRIQLLQSIGNFCDLFIVQYSYD